MAGQNLMLQLELDQPGEQPRNRRALVFANGQQAAIGHLETVLPSQRPEVLLRMGIAQAGLQQEVVARFSLLD